jgi:alpha-L-arabinofuranosidase
MFRVATLSVWLGCALPLVGASVSININATNAGPKLNPKIYGIFLEEINHGVDGGLYAEMIRNRGFEDAKPPEGFTFRPGNGNRGGRWMAGTYDAEAFGRFNYFKPDGTMKDFPFWSLIQEGGAKGSMSLDTNNPLDPAGPRSLCLQIDDVASGRVGFANEGFFGVGVAEGKTYSLSFWARADGFSGALTASVEDPSGISCVIPAKIGSLTGEWKQFHATLPATKTVANGHFVLTANSKGKIWFDMVSLFPAETYKNRPNGLRPDLAKFLVDLKPGFVRFPGGCVIEGGTVETAFNWKDSVGPLQSRQEQFGPWGYRETHGMGFYEYLQFCEDLGAEPLYVGFAGETCHFRDVKDVPMDQMGWVTTNFLDAIQFANGSSTTTWGQHRADAGHPDPFNLKLVEVGNEGQARTYPPRYQLVHSALKAQYPDLSYINDFSFINRRQMGTETSDIEDNHYYENPAWFMTHTNLYDSRDRNLPPVYDGEVAVTSGDNSDTHGTLLSALSEGSFLMGLEHNADVVKMVSYAPLLANVRGRTGWHGMIYFDTLHSYATVSYYLWKLFSVNRPDYTVATGIDYHSDTAPPIAGEFGIGTWNNAAEFKDIRIEKDGNVLYSSDFTNGSAGWKVEGGRWSVVDGAYRQQDSAEGLLSYIGNPTWTDYTVTLKARKVGARGEGFLIVFGRKSSDRYWWNVGGYGNTQHGVELNQNVIGRQVRGNLEADRWYDVKVILHGRHMQCFLDGQLINDVEVPSQDRFFANAGRDEATGDLIIKAINVSPHAVSSTLHVNGLSHFASDAAVTVLSSAQLADNNSMTEPTKVIPVSSRIKVPGDTFTCDFPANSLTIVRVNAK